MNCYNLSATNTATEPNSQNSTQKQHSIQLKSRTEIEQNKQYFIYFKFRRVFSSARSGRCGTRYFYWIKSISEVKGWYSGRGWFGSACLLVQNLETNIYTKECCFIFWHFPIWFINIFCAKNWWPEKITWNTEQKPSLFIEKIEIFHILLG